MGLRYEDVAVYWQFSAEVLLPLFIHEIFLESYKEDIQQISPRSIV